MNRKMPHLSVITVVYNNKEKLQETIQSVLDQHYENLEYIVVDGGSTDGTVEVIRKFSQQITVWVSEPDKGIYDAMNKGISMAKGRYLHFLNAGDIFLSTSVLNRHADLLQKDDVDLYKFSYQKGGTVYTEHISYTFLLRYSPNHQSIFYHRRTFDQHRYYDDLRYASDYGHLLWIISNAKIQYLEEALIDFDEDYSASNRKVVSIIWKERAICLARAKSLNLFYRIFAASIAYLMHLLRRVIY